MAGKLDDIRNSRSRTIPNVVVELSLILSLAVVYFGMGKLGLTLAFFNESATAVWPPTGISLAAVLLLGRRVWPGIWLGAFLVNITTAGTVLTSLGIATGNTLEALLGAWLAERFAEGRHAFERSRNLFRYLLLTAVSSTTVSATFGATSLALGGLVRWSQYAPVWMTWWLGDMVSAIIIAPLIVICWTAPWPNWSRRQIVEALLMLTVQLVVSLLVFGNFLAPSFQEFSRSFMCFPPLLWAAYRFGLHGAILAAFVVSCVALYGTLHGYGPTVLSEAHQSLLLLQTFTATITVTNLALSAVVTEHQKAEVELAVWQRELETRVELRTEELAAAHRLLQSEIEERQRLEARMIDLIEREQLRLGQELHDGLGQQLAGIGFLLETLRGKLEEVSSPAVRDVERLEDLIQQSIEQTRNLAKVFYPVELERHGLAMALRALAQRHRRSSETSSIVESEEDGGTNLDGPLAIQLFRIAQEAVQNSERHSHAKHLLIRLAIHDGQVMLTVQDDGIGLPPDFDKAAGMGLRIMQHRARMIGGKLEIRNGPAGGAIVTCAAPFHERPSSKQATDRRSPC